MTKETVRSLFFYRGRLARGVIVVVFYSLSLSLFQRVRTNRKDEQDKKKKMKRKMIMKRPLFHFFSVVSLFLFSVKFFSLVIMTGTAVDCWLTEPSAVHLLFAHLACGTERSRTSRDLRGTRMKPQRPRSITPVLNYSVVWRSEEFIFLD